MCAPINTHTYIISNKRTSQALEHSRNIIIKNHKRLLELVTDQVQLGIRSQVHHIYATLRIKIVQRVWT